MKKIAIIVFTIILIIGTFSANSLTAASKCTCSVEGPSEVYKDGKLLVTFFFDCINSEGFQGTLRYDDSQLVLEDFSQTLTEDWNLDTNKVSDGVKFILYGQKNDVIFGNKRALTALFSVKAESGSTVSVSLGDLKTTDGYNSFSFDGVEYSATILDLPDTRGVGLSLLSVKGVDLVPAFSPEQYSYYLSVPFSMEKLEISARPQTNNATLEVEDVTLVENSVTPVKITVKSNNIPVVYTIYVYRETDPDKLLSSNATVINLQLSDGYVEPEFSDDILSYSVTLQNNIEEFYVEPVLADNKAYYIVDGDGKINVGKNIVKLTVISEDLSVRKVFTLNVTRLENIEDKLPSQENQDPGVFQPWLYLIIIIAVVIIILLVVLLLSIGARRKKKNK